MRSRKLPSKTLRWKVSRFAEWVLYGKWMQLWKRSIYHCCSPLSDSGRGWLSEHSSLPAMEKWSWAWRCRKMAAHTAPALRWFGMYTGTFLQQLATLPVCSGGLQINGWRTCRGRVLQWSQREVCQPWWGRRFLLMPNTVYLQPTGSQWIWCIGKHLTSAAGFY